MFEIIYVILRELNFNVVGWRRNFVKVSYRRAREGRGERKGLNI
jgi:hypothetical protein